jgi:hypothetical protein
MGDVDRTRYIGRQPRCAGLARPDARSAWRLQGFAMFSVIEKASGRWIGGWSVVSRTAGRAPRSAGPSCRRLGQGLCHRAVATAAIDWAFDDARLERGHPHHSIPPTRLRKGVAAKLGSRYLRMAGLPPPPMPRRIEVWGQIARRMAAQREGGNAVITVYGLFHFRQLSQAEVLLLHSSGREFHWVEVDSTGGQTRTPEVPGEESQRQVPLIEARRRPDPDRVQRDPVLAGRRHARSCRSMPGSARSDELDVLRAVQP